MKPTRALFSSFCFIIASYYISILLHEYGHATTAWLLGYKSSPFAIQYGSWYLIPVSEHVNYQKLFAAGHGIAGALIGISGITVTTVLFLTSLTFLNTQRILQKPYLCLFFFWLAGNNLMEIYLYIVNRCFTTGDISEFTQGLGISTFWLFIPGTLLACLAVYRYYWKELPKIYQLIDTKCLWIKRLFLYLTFWQALLLIVYWSPPKSHATLTYVMAVFSFLYWLLIIVRCDPKRFNTHIRD